MACRRCGCRMVTKVGRTTPMLICSECALPVDERETTALKRKRLWGAITLLGMALVSGLMLFLATFNEMRTDGELSGDTDKQGEAANEERSEP